MFYKQNYFLKRFYHFKLNHPKCNNTTHPPRNKLTPPEAVVQDLVTSLATFLDYMSSLTGRVRWYTNITTSTTANSAAADVPAIEEEEWYSSLWRSSLTVFVLAAAISFMSYAVLVTTYIVIHFT